MGKGIWRQLGRAELWLPFLYALPNIYFCVGCVTYNYIYTHVSERALQDIRHMMGTQSIFARCVNDNFQERRYHIISYPPPSVTPGSQ